MNRSLASQVRHLVAGAAALLAIPIAADARVRSTGEVRRWPDGVCELSGSDLIFQGGSDRPLFLCLNQYRDAHPKRLVINSPGGEVDLSMASGVLVDVLDLEVVVQGKCASSCANYVVPAARRLVVTKGSLILVHGAAEEPTEERISRFEAMLNQNPSLADSSRVVANFRTNAALTWALQTQFVERFHIGARYFNTNLFEAQTTSVQGPAEMLVVSPRMIAACLPRLVRGRIWYPETAEEKADVVRRFPRNTFYWTSDSGVGACD